MLSLGFTDKGELSFKCKLKLVVKLESVSDYTVFVGERVDSEYNLFLTK